jgi:hypothetical protein
MQLAQGVTITVTGPMQYTVNYFNGSQTYTEPFVEINYSKAAVDQFLAPYNTLITGLESSMGLFMGAIPATGGAAAPVAGAAAVAAAIAALAIKVGDSLIRSILLNPDGSFTLAIAYHYFGKSDAGVDPTATPIPGVDPNQWFAYVNDLIRQASGQLAVAHGIALPQSDGISLTRTWDKKAATFHGRQFDMKEASSNPPSEEGEDFYSSFSSCMSAQGLPVPASLFSSVQAAISTAYALYSAYATWGAEATISTLIAECQVSALLYTAGTATISYYLGACIGCCINAGISSAALPAIAGVSTTA